MGATLEVGHQAPTFTLPGSDGKSYDLEVLRGKTVVVAWFPKAFYIGPDGKILYVDRSVSPRTAGADVAAQPPAQGCSTTC